MKKNILFILINFSARADSFFLFEKQRENLFSFNLIICDSSLQVWILLVIILFVYSCSLLWNKQRFRWEIVHSSQHCTTASSHRHRGIQEITRVFATWTSCAVFSASCAEALRKIWSGFVGRIKNMQALSIDCWKTMRRNSSNEELF